MGHSWATSGNPVDAPMKTTTANLGQDIATAPAVAAMEVAREAAMEAARVCGNPLRDEPEPAVVAAVRRFGLVGLAACAVGAWLGRVMVYCHAH